MGYDIADYYDIDPKYGSLSHVDELIKGLKERGMKLMVSVSGIVRRILVLTALCTDGPCCQPHF